MATTVVIDPKNGDDTKTNGRLRSSLYDLVGQSAVYESFEDDVDQETVDGSLEIPKSFENTLTLFWLTNLTAAQLQNLSSYKDVGVSLNHHIVEFQRLANTMKFYFQSLGTYETENSLAACEPSLLGNLEEASDKRHEKMVNSSIAARALPFYITDDSLFPNKGDADPSLAIISQQPNEARTVPRYPIGDLNKYAYNVNQRDGTTVYIIDPYQGYNTAPFWSRLKTVRPNLHSGRTCC